MLQIIKTQPRTNQYGAMESETISKNRAYPKSLTSRGHVLAIMFLGLCLFSCGQNSNQGAESSKETVQQPQKSSLKTNEMLSKTTDLRYYERIAGTWLSVETETTNESMVSIESYETYYETGSYRYKGDMKITYFNIENHGKVELNYTLIVSGKYRIKNSVVSYDLNIHSFELLPQTYPTPDRVQEYMYDTITEYLSAEYKKIYINNDLSDTIVKISGNSMTCTDSKGNRKTKKKI